MTKAASNNDPEHIGIVLRRVVSGREAERRMLRWLRNYYSSLIMARPYDEKLSRKLDCIEFLKHN